MKEISSKDNQWVKLACALKTKKGRQEQRRVLIEGVRIISDAAVHGIQDVTCFISSKGLQRNGVDILQKKGKQLGWRFFFVTDSVYDKLKDTQNSQGIAAILPFFEYSAADVVQPSDRRLVLYLQAIQDPGNLGTIIRTAAAGNVAAILLSPDSVDLYNDKTMRSAMGALFKIPVVQHVELADVLHFCKVSGRHLFGTSPYGRISYADMEYSRPIVLAFGNEGNGLTDDFLQSCDELISIPMCRNTESLNLSMSVGIVIYKAWEIQAFREDRND
ncbi:TrmH family RNA methyltransferase [Megasphaera sueciensis]|uniref:TrmH family RNA methyltransferase n=1 Tax=Megasphaera sueciensis TaxID=349094 RepID=UPI003D07A7C2